MGRTARRSRRSCVAGGITESGLLRNWTVFPLGRALATARQSGTLSMLATQSPVGRRASRPSGLRVDHGSKPGPAPEARNRKARHGSAGIRPLKEHPRSPEGTGMVQNGSQPTWVDVSAGPGGRGGPALCQLTSVPPPSRAPRRNLPSPIYAAGRAAANPAPG